MSDVLSRYEEYNHLTQRKGWASICALNGLDFSTCRFATMKEMQSLPSQLQSGEVVLAFTAGVMSDTGDSNKTDFGVSTWVVVLTDRRFLFLDAALLSKSLDVHSILHKNVQGVRVAQGFVLGKISIDTGGRTTTIDNCEKKSVKILGDIANDWLQVLEERKVKPSGTASNTGESGLDKLKKLGELKALGLVTEQEFNEAKAKVLSAL